MAGLYDYPGIKRQNIKPQVTIQGSANPLAVQLPACLPALGLFSWLGCLSYCHNGETFSR
jgi:hypothetical protein